MAATNKRELMVPARETSEFALQPVTDADKMLQGLQELEAFISKALKRGKVDEPDADIYELPGSNKPALSKSGAEKILNYYGLYADPVLESSIENWDAEPIPFLKYTFKCYAKRIKDDKIVGVGHGSCNSREEKFYWRNDVRRCPAMKDDGEICNFEIRHSKPPKDGWYCWAKIGGCGATFDEKDLRIIDQSVGKVPNDRIADQDNTILKQAEKRSKVGSALAAGRCSNMFTQDEEVIVTVIGANGGTAKTPETDVVDTTVQPVKEKTAKKNGAASEITKEEWEAKKQAKAAKTADAGTVTQKTAAPPAKNAEPDTAQSAEDVDDRAAEILGDDEDAYAGDENRNLLRQFAQAQGYGIGEENKMEIGDIMKEQWGITKANIETTFTNRIYKEAVMWFTENPKPQSEAAEI